MLLAKFDKVINYIRCMSIHNQYFIFTLKVNFYCWLKTVSHSFHIQLIINLTIFT